MRLSTVPESWSCRVGYSRGGGARRDRREGGMDESGLDEMFLSTGIRLHV